MWRHISRDFKRTLKIINFILASANDNLILISYFELNTSETQVSFIFWLIILMGRHIFGYVTYLYFYNLLGILREIYFIWFWSKYNLLTIMEKYLIPEKFIDAFKAFLLGNKKLLFPRVNHKRNFSADLRRPELSIKLGSPDQLFLFLIFESFFQKHA